MEYATEICEHFNEDNYTRYVGYIDDNSDLKQYYFNDNQIVMFDGDLHHSATNQSSKDWILFVLRINKEEFNYENIIT